MIMTKTVGELCKQIKGIYNLNGSADTVITGISSDSRQIEAGYLFVCISGVHVDGATFAAQAVEKGAVAVLTTKHLDRPRAPSRSRYRTSITPWKTWSRSFMIIRARRCA